MVSTSIFLFVLILFSKYAYAIDMPNKDSNSGARILKDVLKMGMSEAIASDDGGEFKGRFKEILNAEGIDHIIMTTHVPSTDRFTRNIENMLFERVQYTRQEWHRLLPDVINQYNNTTHNSTKFRLADAIQDKIL